MSVSSRKRSKKRFAFMWICPKCGHIHIAEHLRDVYEYAQLHIVYSHKEGFRAKRLNRLTIDLEDYGVIQPIDYTLYQLYKNPQYHKQFITYMRESGLLKSKI